MQKILAGSADVDGAIVSCHPHGAAKNAKYVRLSRLLILCLSQVFYYAAPICNAAEPTDWDEEMLNGLVERTAAAKPFVDTPRPGQAIPEYLRPHDYQQGKFCGPNALYICLRMLGYEVTYEEVLQTVTLGPNGASMASLVAAGEKFGLHLRPLKDVTPEDLAEVGKPFIAHFNTPQGSPNDAESLDHYVVIVGYNPDMRQFRQIDPSACAYLRMSTDYVARSFSGHGLRIENAQLDSRSVGHRSLQVAVLVITLVVAGVYWARIERRYRQYVAHAG